MHLAEGITLKEGLVGGLILGSSSAAFMYLTGKITGLSGIIEGLIVEDGQDWHVSYVLGLITSGYIGSLLLPQNFPETDLSNYSLALSGLIIGFGTRLAGGCTSGHGLCGLGRFSPRSLAAVLSFMASGALTATLVRSPAYSSNFITKNPSTFENNLPYIIPAAATLVLAYLRANHRSISNSTSQKIQTSTSVSPYLVHITSFISGLTFGAGLVISGMASPEKVLNFLDFTGVKGWDPTLMSVLGAGLSVTALSFPYFQRTNTIAPLCKQGLGKVIKIGSVPENLVIDWKVIIGSVLFGVGWGISGICPGPGVVNIIANSRIATVYIPALFTGILFKDALFNKR